MTEDFVTIGKILRARGLSGEIAVLPLTDFPERYLARKQIWLNTEPAREVTIEEVRFHKEQILLKLKDVNDRNTAEALEGTLLSIRRNDLQELPQGEYYHFDLIGMQVYDEDERLLGKIVEVMSLPANDVWRVEGQQSFLLPATGNIILDVNQENRKVIIKIIEGLLE